MDIKLLFSGFFKLYFYWEILVIISTSAVVINSFYSIITKKIFNFFDLRLTLFTLIFNYILFIIGIVVFIANFVLLFWDSDLTLIVPQNNILFGFTQHLLNLFSLLVMTIGWSLHKKSTLDFKRFLRIFIFYLMGLIILIGKFLWLK